VQRPVPAPPARPTNPEPGFGRALFCASSGLVHRFNKSLTVHVIWNSKFFHWKRTGWVFISSMPLNPSSTLSEHFLIDPTYLLGLQGVFPVSAKT
jgi:hypothetical protein